MGDAVIVSAARTAIGTARRGLARRPRRVRARQVRRSRRRSSARASRPRTSTTSSSARCSRAVATSPATSPIELGMLEVPGSRAQPPLRVRHGVGADRGREHPRRHGPRRDRRRHPELSRSPRGLQEAQGPVRRASQPWLSPQPSRDARRARRCDMSITVGWNTAQKCNISPRGAGRLGVPLAQRAVAAIDDGRFRTRSSRRGPGGEATDARSSTSTSTRAATRRSRSSRRCRVLHPEIPGFSITAGNSSGLNDAACAMVVCDADYAAAHGLEPLAIVRSWASAGLPPADTGLGPTLAIPRRSTAPASDRSRRRRSSRSTRRSRPWRSRAAGSSASRTRSST